MIAVEGLNIVDLTFMVNHVPVGVEAAVGEGVGSPWGLDLVGGLVIRDGEDCLG
jgi:hypothetical protein